MYCIKGVRYFPELNTILLFTRRGIFHSYVQVYFLRCICDKSKLYSIQNKVNKTCNLNLKRRDDVIISRIPRGHSRLTSFISSERWTPAWMHFCDCPLTIQHIFLQCSDTFLVQESLFRIMQTMQGILTKSDVDFILKILNKIWFLQ